MSNYLKMYVGQYVEFGQEGLKVIGRLIGKRPDGLWEVEHYKFNPKGSRRVLAGDLIKPLLRKLSSMTEDECLELCKIVSSDTIGDYRYAKWTVEADIDVKMDWHIYSVRNKNCSSSFTVDLIDGEVRMYGDTEETDISTTSKTEPDPSSVQHHYWQWYADKGFDVPCLPNYTTLIKSGKAIDIATIKGVW